MKKALVVSCHYSGGRPCDCSIGLHRRRRRRGRRRGRRWWGRCRRWWRRWWRRRRWRVRVRVQAVRVQAVRAQVVEMEEELVAALAEQVVVPGARGEAVQDQVLQALAREIWVLQ